MDYPIQLFRRIRERRARTDTCSRTVAPPTPAPVAPTPTMKDAPAEPTVPESPAPARRAAGHALYSQVMRRHDRAKR